MEQTKLTREQEAESIINQAIDLGIEKGCYKKADLVLILNALAVLKEMATPLELSKPSPKSFSDTYSIDVIS